MPRKITAKVTGVWEKVPGSGIWWIRYRIHGKLKREKVGRKSDAVALYQKRKSETRAGVKLPENLRNQGVRFKALVEARLDRTPSQRFPALATTQIWHSPEEHLQRNAKMHFVSPSTWLQLR